MKLLLKLQNKLAVNEGQWVSLHLHLYLVIIYYLLYYMKYFIICLEVIKSLGYCCHNY